MIRCNTYRLSIAPMLDRTDRHYRAMVRQITKHTMLYTEMVTTGAILFGEHDTHLKFHEMEHPVALQLGGDDPDALRACARIAEDYGYDEININVGCPSNRVQNGNFGACLMSQPNRVAECVAAICNEVSVPVTVKHRIGIDHNDSYDFMANFVDTVAPAGVRAFIVHARIAWLQGLSPKENRTVPPLRYHDVHRLKRDFPDLKIVLNGGITTLDDGQDHLRHVDGVMIGRAAYENPMMFSKADSSFFGAHGSETSPQDVVRAMLPYVDKHLSIGGRLHDVTRHMLNLFSGQPGARSWRRAISTCAHVPGAGTEVLTEALMHLEEAQCRLAERTAVETTKSPSLSDAHPKRREPAPPSEPRAP